MNELQLTEFFDPAEISAYIQHWLKDETPPDTAIRQVFSATDQIGEGSDSPCR